MITRKNYKRIENYSTERQALDDMLHRFNENIYNTMCNMLRSNQIDDFDNVNEKENFIICVKKSIDDKNWVKAACFLALLFNFENITNQEKFNILENELDKLKIGDSAENFLKTFEKITGNKINVL